MREKKTVPGTFSRAAEPLDVGALQMTIQSLPGEAGLPRSSGGQWIPQAVGAGPTGHGDPWALGRLERRQDDGRAGDRQPWTKDQPPVQVKGQEQARSSSRRRLRRLRANFVNPYGSFYSLK